MIEKLILRNFQTHQNLNLELAPGITCIVGSSDVGKSAVLRALYWLTFNDPAGVEFIHHGAKTTTVKARVDGEWIERVRGESWNTYRLSAQTYKAFGSGIPEPIQKALGLGPDNFQMQLDPHFWFSLSAGQVSKELNRIVNLDEIDAALTKNAQAVRNAKAVVGVTEQRWRAAKNRAIAMRGIPKLYREVRSVARLEAKYEELGNSADKLRQLTTDARALGQASKPIPSLGQLPALITQRNAVQAQAGALSKLITEFKQRKSELWQARAQLKELRGNLERETKGRCPVCGKPTS